MSKFAIDPGHGCYPDTGAEGYLNEQNCALDIANKVISKLQALGHTAWNVRPSSALSVTNSLQKRCDGSANADYLVSIHLNAGGGKGSEIFSMSAEGNNLASKVLNELVGLGFTNRGVKDGSRLYVIRHSNPVAILIEVCFVDNPTDADLYNSLGCEAVANAIVKGLTGQSISSITTHDNLISTTKDSKLKSQIQALVYNFNLDYNAKLTHNDGNIYQELLDALKSAGSLIVKGHKSHVVLWIQQKLVAYGYLKKGSYANMIYDEVTFQAVTNMQKNWGRATSGILNIETWNIFLNN